MNISVIVPVYNVEEYLHYAVESLAKQTYKDFEVILVNDGSTDNSGRLCDEYEKQYDWIRVYHKENGGLSDARNYGVSRATGDWIFFLDPDDYIESFTLELLVRLQRTYNVNLISTKVQSTNSYEIYSELNANDFDITKIKKLSKDEALSLMLENKIDTVSACAKLYRKTILEKKPFPIGKIYEDFFVIAEHLRLAEDIIIYPVVTYHYYNRPGSIVRSNFTAKQYDFFDAGEFNRGIIQEYYQNKNLEKNLNVKIVTGSFSISELAARNKKSELKNIVKKIQPFYWGIIFNSKTSIKLKLKYSLLICSPAIYYQVKHLMRKE